MKRKKTQHTSRRRLVRPKLYTWLYATGAVLVFTSWVAQNYWTAKWTQESQQQEQTHRFVQNGELLRQIWLIEYNSSQSREKPNAQVTALAAFHVLGNTKDVLAWIGIAHEDNPDKRNQVIRDKNRAIAEAEALLNQGRYQELFAQLDKVNQEYEQTIEDKAVGIMSWWVDIQTYTAWWKNVFIWAYLLGAICFALGFIVKEIWVLLES